MHFLIPGCGETLRVKGRAMISADPALAASFMIDGKPARTVIVIAVERLYFHCAKAILRSRLWDASQHVARERLPSVNAMLAATQWQRCRAALPLRRAAMAKVPAAAAVVGDDP